MSDLRAPLKTVAPAPVDEVTVLRMWRAVGRRRARAAGGASPWRLRAAVAMAAVVAGAGIAVAAVRLEGRHDAGPLAGPLHRAGGAELASVAAPAEQPAPVALDDGSTIVLAPGARLAMLENSGTSLVALLETGRATFDVAAPGGGRDGRDAGIAGASRRWTVECGLATVEVAGARFSIERRPGHARVEVERGIALVRGEHVKDRIQRLGAGEVLEIDDGAGSAGPGPAAGGSVGATPAVGSSAPVVVSPVPAVASPTAVASAQGTGHDGGDPHGPGPAGGGSSHDGREQWRALAQRGEFKEAYRAIAPGGVAGEAQGASVDDLLLLADVARLSGHPADAVAPLSRVIGAHDPRSPVAAFTLGRVQLDALGQASAAADTFARAIALGLPQGLREDAYVRVVEARARAGNREGARAAAAEYEARYPNGDRRAQVRAWVDRE